MGWWIAFSGVAAAGVPVVFDGSTAEEALAAVAERTGLPESQLDALPLATLRETPPDVRGDAVLRRCATTPIEGDPVRTDLARARAAFVKDDRFKAMDYLDLAVAKIGCLSEVVDPPVAAQVFAFRGALAATGGDTEAAKTAPGEFRTAIELVRDLAYPDWLPEAAKPAFDAVRTEVDEADAAPLALLTVVPFTTVSGPWVDGIEVDGQTQLRPGLHLLQYSSPKGIRSGWLSIGTKADIVLPGQVRGPLLERLTTPLGPPLVSALLEVAVKDLASAYITHNGGLWLIAKASDGEVTVEVVDPPHPPSKKPKDREPEPKKRKKRK